MNVSQGIVSFPFQSGCSVYKAANQAVAVGLGTNINIKINFDTENYDTKGEYDNTVSYRFTAKEDGIYDVKLIIDTAYDANTVWQRACIDVNGTKTVESTLHRIITNAEGSVSSHVALTAGQYIEGYLHLLSGAGATAFNISGGAYLTQMTISKVA